MLYNIFEHFLSWQGEGVHTGKSAYFLRTYGCPIKCPWCDSSSTFDNSKFGLVEKMSPSDIFDTTKKHNFNFIVITGGEPTIYDFNELISYFNERSYIKFHLETSGAFKIKGNFDWITVSPKKYRLPILENIEKADEIKIIVDSLGSVEFWLEKFPVLKQKENVWLHPEFSQIKNKEILNNINFFVSKYNNFRAGFQIHKLYEIQ